MGSEEWVAIHLADRASVKKLIESLRELIEDKPSFRHIHINPSSAESPIEIVLFGPGQDRDDVETRAARDGWNCRRAINRSQKKE